MYFNFILITYKLKNLIIYSIISYREIPPYIGITYEHGLPRYIIIELIKYPFNWTLLAYYKAELIANKYT